MSPQRRLHGGGEQRDAAFVSFSSAHNNSVVEKVDILQGLVLV